MLALAAGLATPDSLSGIIAVDAMLPTVSGWNPPLAPLGGLPVLIAGEHPQLRHAFGRSPSPLGTTRQRLR